MGATNLKLPAVVALVAALFSAPAVEARFCSASDINFTNVVLTVTRPLPPADGTYVASLGMFVDANNNLFPSDTLASTTFEKNNGASVFDLYVLALSGRADCVNNQWDVKQCLANGSGLVDFFSYDLGSFVAIGNATTQYTFNGATALGTRMQGAYFLLGLYTAGSSGPCIVSSIAALYDLYP